MSEPDPVRYEQQDGFAVLTLDRPPCLNALDPPLLRRLAALLDKLRDDDAIAAVIVTGAGGNFSAGADIRVLAAASPAAVRAFARLAVELNRRIEELGKPVVAAIEGAALGGGLELAEACWLRIAAADARLGHPEVQIGAVAGFGGTTRLPRLVGRGRAAELLLRGRVVGADEALRIGLVHEVVPAGRALAAAQALVAELRARSPAALRLTWEALHRGLDLPLDEAARLGADCFGLVAAGEDFREGTQAFLEKRRPRRGGR